MKEAADGGKQLSVIVLTQSSNTYTYYLLYSCALLIGHFIIRSNVLCTGKDQFIVFFLNF